MYSSSFLSLASLSSHSRSCIYLQVRRSSKRRQNNRKHPRFCRRTHRTSYNSITSSITWNPIPYMDSWRNSLLRGIVHERKRKRKHQQITSRHPHHHRSSSHAWIGACLINIKNSVRKIPFAISLSTTP